MSGPDAMVETNAIVEHGKGRRIGQPADSRLAKERRCYLACDGRRPLENASNSGPFRPATPVTSGVVGGMAPLRGWAARREPRRLRFAPKRELRGPSDVEPAALRVRSPRRS